MRIILRYTLIVLIIKILIVSHADADFVFNNFGASDSYNTGSGYVVASAGSPYGIDYDKAYAFAPLYSSYYLDTIKLAVGHVSGANDLEVWLMSDSNDNPGSILETFTFTNAMMTYGSANGVLTGNSLLHPLLNVNTQYWLAASTPSFDTTAVWYKNSIGDTGRVSPRQNNESWLGGTGTRGAFSIAGTPVVPEPVSSILFVAGGALLAGQRYLRRIKCIGIDLNS